MEGRLDRADVLNLPANLLFRAGNQGLCKPHAFAAKLSDDVQRLVPFLRLKTINR